MRSNRSRLRLLALGLAAALLLSLPLGVGAQTASDTSTASAAPAAQANGITSPKDGAVLSGTVEVRGYADSPNFEKWQLDLLPNGDPNAGIFLAFGETPGEFTYSFDTSNLPAGEHALRLRVVRLDSNYDEYFTKFTIGQAAAGAKAVSAATEVASSSAITPTAPAATTTAPAATAAAGKVGVTANGFAAPREGQTVSGQFEVRGYADDPSFKKWQLDLLPNGDPNAAIFLAFGETSGVFTYTLNVADYPPGEHALRLRVVRQDSNYDEYTTNFKIGAAAPATEAAKEASTEAAAPAAAMPSAEEGAKVTAGGEGAAAAATPNGITSPKEGATVKDAVEVTGYADSPDFLKWQLDLLLNDDASQAAFLAFGETPGKFTYTLDTTDLPAGEYTLRLRVVRQDSNYDEYFTKFTLAK